MAQGALFAASADAFDFWEWRILLYIAHGRTGV